MKVFVAGAGGAIGTPLVRELLRAGHEVTGMTRSPHQAETLSRLGVSVVSADALDPQAVLQALSEARPEVVIDELTSLPRDPADYPAAFPEDRRLRLEGGGILHQGARAAGVRRYLQQSSGFFLKSRDVLADETAGFAIDATSGIAATARMYAEIEKRLAGSEPMEWVALRYGFFYGPNTWYSPEGAAANHAREGASPVIGGGEGVWSFVHIEDAAGATVAALTSPPGIYNIVDDDPSPVRIWLPAFARHVGAPVPAQLTADQARSSAGEDAVYYATSLQGASNARAKSLLHFAPRRLEWLS